MAKYFYARSAAFVAALTYLVGISVMAAVLLPAGYDPIAASSQAIQIASTNHAWLGAWYLTIYSLNGFCLMVLALVLGQYAAHGPLGIGLLRAIGMLWGGLLIGIGMMMNVGLDVIADQATADPKGMASLWQTLSVIEQGLGGGNEILGAIFAGLCARHRKQIGLDSRWAAGLGWLLLALGLATLVPGLEDAAAAAFGLLYILWFVVAALTLSTATPLGRERAQPL